MNMNPNHKILMEKLRVANLELSKCGDRVNSLTLRFPFVDYSKVLEPMIESIVSELETAVERLLAAVDPLSDLINHLRPNDYSEIKVVDSGSESELVGELFDGDRITDDFTGGRNHPKLNFKGNANDVPMSSVDAKVSGGGFNTEIFSVGDHVLYVPRTAEGDRNHRDCQRGIVSRCGWFENGTQKVFVRYSTGSTGSLTPAERLVKL